MNSSRKNLCDSRCPSHSGILDGTCKGSVWCYPKENPYFAVTYSYCVGGCGVFGEVRAMAPTRHDFEIVFTNLRKKGINEFEFSSEKTEMTEQILALFPEKDIKSELEYSYRSKKEDVLHSEKEEVLCSKKADILHSEKEDILHSKNDSSMDGISTISNEYRIDQVNDQFLKEKSKYENIEILQERMNQSWESEQDFLERSLAYVALKEDRIVGIIFGSARYENCVAIDIEVEKQHRRKGLAEALARQFLNTCKEKGYVAQWDCVESNLASQMLAKKIGLELFKQREYYWFEI